MPSDRSRAPQNATARLALSIWLLAPTGAHADCASFRADYALFKTGVARLEDEYRRADAPKSAVDEERLAQIQALADIAARTISKYGAFVGRLNDPANAACDPALERALSERKAALQARNEKLGREREALADGLKYRLAPKTKAEYLWGLAQEIEAQKDKFPLKTETGSLIAAIRIKGDAVEYDIKNNAEAEQPDFRLRLLAHFCTNAAYARAIDDGVAFQHNYIDQDGAVVATYRTDKRACDLNRFWIGR